jgi:hypothetical protein
MLDLVGVIAGMKTVTVTEHKYSETAQIGASLLQPMTNSSLSSIAQRFAVN